MCRCTRKHTQVHIGMHTHVHKHTQVHMGTFKCTYKHSQVHTGMRTGARTGTYKHTHRHGISRAGRLLSRLLPILPCLHQSHGAREGRDNPRVQGGGAVFVYSDIIKTVQ